MIVLVEDGVFAPGQADPFELLELFRLGHRGWHHVQINPSWDRQLPLAVNQWLGEQSPTLRELSELVLQAGLEASVRVEQSEVHLRICADFGPSWQTTPPRLQLEEALRILSSPLRLMVEDKHNDGDFLCAVTPEHWRGALKKAMEEGQIEIIHGGGLPRMGPQIETFSPEAIMRLWVLFDSDAETPGEASSDSRRLCELCKAREVGCHQLQRRAVENYLPLQALAAWAQIGPTNVRKGRKRSYLSFKEMSADQRHHYPMRSGFNRYLNKGKPVPDFYGAFGNRVELRDGFSGVRELFRQEQFQFHEEWLRRDGQQAEMMRMTRSIFRRL